MKGDLKAEEIIAAREYWIRSVQEAGAKSENKTTLSNHSVYSVTMEFNDAEEE